MSTENTCKTCRFRSRGRCVKRGVDGVLLDEHVRPKRARKDYLCSMWGQKLPRRAFRTAARTFGGWERVRMALLGKIQYVVRRLGGKARVDAIFAAIYRDDELRVPGMRINDILETARYHGLTIHGITGPWVTHRPDGTEIIEVEVDEAGKQ